jgi:hypothetical protein
VHVESAVGNGAPTAWVTVVVIAAVSPVVAVPYAVLVDHTVLQTAATAAQQPEASTGTAFHPETEADVAHCISVAYCIGVALGALGVVV